MRGFARFFAALWLCAHAPHALAQDVTTYKYDALGRLAASTVAGGPNDGVTTAVCLDPASNRTQLIVATGTVVCSSNHAPVAMNDTVYVEVCSYTVINVTANDTDADGDPITLISVSGNGMGSPSVYSATSIDYWAYGLPGVDTVSYVIQDSHGATASGTLSVHITGMGFC